MPAERYFPGMESTQRSPEPMVPDLLLFNTAPVSIDRRGQDVRYALLDPLPLAFHRAEITALNVQAPGWCRFFAQLAQMVGARRKNSKASSLQIFNRARAQGPTQLRKPSWFCAPDWPQRVQECVPRNGVRGKMSWRTRRLCRRSPIAFSPGDSSVPF